MTTKETLLKLKSQLEQSITETNAAKQRAIELSNYQAVVDFEQQIIGRRYAIALINEELRIELINGLDCPFEMRVVQR